MDNNQPQLSKRFLKLFLLVSVLLLIGAGLNWLNPEKTQAASGINPQLNYQGKLTTIAGVQVADGNWSFRFRIYDASAAGNLLWTERWTSTTTRAATVNGVFSVALGSLGQTDLLSGLDWNSDTLYLQVDLDADNNGSWEESFATRKRLTASAYAFNADQLDGYNATTTAAASSTIPVFDTNLTLNLFEGGVSSTMATTTNLYVGANATTTGRLVLGAIDPTNDFGNLWVGGDSWFNGSATTTGALYANEFASTTALYVGIDGQTATSTWINGGMIVDTDTLVVNANENRVGIGTATPNNLLQVYDLIDFNNADLNTKIGYQAGKNIVSGATDNTFLGYQAGYSSLIASTNAADANSAFGDSALYSNTTGKWNSAVGYHSLYANTAGSWNTAVGMYALKDNTIGNWNTAFGTQALFSNTEGIENLAFGGSALYDNTIGKDNTAIGDTALGENIRGNYNTALGYAAGMTSIGSYNLFLGYGSDLLYAASSSDNAIAIGHHAIVGGSNMMALGGTGVDAITVGIGTTTPKAVLTIASSTEQLDNLENLVQVATSTNQGIFIINSDGKVGISTSTPSAMLAIENYYDADNSIYVSSGAALTIGGVWTDASSAELKENFVSLDNNEILSKILGLSLKEYNYIKEPDATRHFGATAEDWYANFGLGNDTSISGKDTAMIALAGLQALAGKFDGLNLNGLSASLTEPLTVIDNPDLDIKTLAVQEAAAFYGTIYVRGEAGFESKVVFNDDIEVKGKIYASADQAGTAVILANATSTEIIFAKEYEAIPKIVATARKPVALGIIDQTVKSFRVFVNEPVAEDLIFDWLALAVKDGGLAAGAELPLEPVLGCLDFAASNYNPAATQDDGSCVYPPSAEPAAETPPAESPPTEPAVEPVIEPVAETLPIEPAVIEPAAEPAAETLPAEPAL